MEAALEKSMGEGPYEALPSSEHIRLLRFEGKPPEQEYLSFVMEIFLITDSALPNYRALSYTWDSPVILDDPDDDEDSEDAIEALIKVAQQISLEDSEEPMVFCNGYAMVVISNLHDALYQLADYTDVGHICVMRFVSTKQTVRRRVSVFPLWATFFHPLQRSLSGWETIRNISKISNGCTMRIH